jgi:PiT family inorganic phosphate transporter
VPVSVVIACQAAIAFGTLAGVGAAKKVSAVRWGVAKGIVTAWIITIPASAAVAALIYGLSGLFG